MEETSLHWPFARRMFNYQIYCKQPVHSQLISSNTGRQPAPNQCWTHFLWVPKTIENSKCRLWPNRARQVLDFKLLRYPNLVGWRNVSITRCSFQNVTCSPNNALLSSAKASVEVNIDHAGDAAVAIPVLFLGPQILGWRYYAFKHAQDIFFWRSYLWTYRMFHNSTLNFAMMIPFDFP